MAIFALRTTFGQELSVSRMIEAKVKKNNERASIDESKERINIYAIVVTDSLRGYVFVEADDVMTVEKVIQNIRHVKRRVVKGESIPLEELKGILIPKPAAEGLSEGDLVEIIDGPFKNSRARIKRVDETREEVTVEFLEGVMIPITLHADYVRRIEKAKDEDAFDL